MGEIAITILVILIIMWLSDMAALVVEQRRQ